MGEVGVAGDLCSPSESGEEELCPLLELSLAKRFPFGPPGGFSEMGEKDRYTERLTVEAVEETTRGEGEGEGLGEGVQRSESPRGTSPSSSPVARNGSSFGRFTASSTLQA